MQCNEQVTSDEGVGGHLAVKPLSNISATAR